MKYCGIDLHSNNSVVSVLDEEDHVVVEKRLPNDLAKIIGLIKPWQEELAGVTRTKVVNWLRVFRKSESAARAHKHWVRGKPVASGKIRLLWRAKWRRARGPSVRFV